MKAQLTRLSFFGLFATLIFSSCSKSNDAVAVSPTAKFSYTSIRNFPVRVNLTNTSDQIGTPGYSYTWFFGDGTQSTLLNPVHTYTTAGSYLISLQEDTPSGSGTVAGVLDLETPTPTGTSGRPGSTNFTYTVDQSFNVTFTDQSQNAATKYWTFGDGTDATNPGSSFVHTFSGSGPFIVQLTATASGGGSAQSSATISF